RRFRTADSQHITYDSLLTPPSQTRRLCRPSDTCSPISLMDSAGCRLVAKQDFRRSESGKARYPTGGTARGKIRRPIIAQIKPSIARRIREHIFEYAIVIAVHPERRVDRLGPLVGRVDIQEEARPPGRQGLAPRHVVQPPQDTTAPRVWCDIDRLDPP